MGSCQRGDLTVEEWEVISLILSAFGAVWDEWWPHVPLEQDQREKSVVDERPRFHLVESNAVRKQKFKKREN